MIHYKEVKPIEYLHRFLADYELKQGKPLKDLLKVGDKVLYGKYSGTEVTVGDEQYLILRESDVLAVIKS